ncbi:uncharacterized protein FMAN_15419 [Fusarium mangiferae]|uniref:Uncharacterized protein n=1 Tax=Fusarium mangiferae TaxID=192010 RepID=A0A1L7UEK0_FUSMA|nr:uncharacterized protein FMAN_15419 [Fusarium mangiferae]CVL09078.1 uncharacterized protein FMAN_15419 [Fusarium mangiferae]
MKFVSTLLFPLSYGVLALQSALRHADPQLVHLTFYGGLDSYFMTFRADGSTRKTDHDLSVDFIDNSDYNALEQCFFAIEGQAKLTPKVSTKDGSQHILVNPSRVITAVRQLCSYIRNGPVKPEPEHNSILDSLPNTPMKREQPGFEYEQKMDMNMAHRGSIGLSIPSNSFGMYSYSPDASMGPASLMTTPPQSISGSEAA